MAILRSQLDPLVKELTPFLNEVIGGDFDSFPDVAGQFLNRKSATSGWEDIGTRSTLGAFELKSEIGEQAEDNYLVGPQMRVAMLEYAKRVPTSRIALQDSSGFEEASKMLAGIGSDIRTRADDTKEILGHDILNSTSHLTPDGIALFSASHVNLQGDTYGNLIASAALSETTLEAAILKLKQMHDDRGFPISQMAARLIVPQELEWTALKILGTDRELGSNNNDINLMSNQNLQLVVSPYMTADDEWFVQATSHGLNWYDRESGNVWNDYDDNRGIVEQGMTFRSAIAAADPRGIIKCTASA